MRLISEKYFLKITICYKMELREGGIYHIYNQGNNRGSVFFSHRNYHFFLRKMHSYIAPYGQFIAYCLMPNHFHWLFMVDRLYCRLGELNPESSNPQKQQGINESIGIVLRSYTRAVNKENGWSGSLFRIETKAKECLVGMLPDFDLEYNSSNYLNKCFHYIHLNPVKAGLVSLEEDWMFSSAFDYVVGNKDSICNIGLGRKLIGLPVIKS